MESILVHRNVHIENIAFLQRSSIGDSVADDLIDRSAARAREVIVIKGRRVRALRNDVLVNCLVDLLGCDSNLDFGVSDVERFTSNQTRLSDSFNRLGSVYGNLLIGELLEVLIRFPRFRVVGLFNVIRNLAVTSE